MNAESRAQFERIVSIRLKHIRRERKLTQMRAAELVSRPQSYISKVENGDQHLTIAELLTFAAAYRVNLLDIIADFVGESALKRALKRYEAWHEAKSQAIQKSNTQS